MAVKKGDKIVVEYTGTLDSGEIFDSSSHGDHSHPLEFIVGSGQVISGFDKAVMGMNKGEKKEFKLTPLEAYGETDNTLMREIPRSNLPPGHEPKPGMMLLMATSEGHQVPVKIASVSSDKITLDLNHPLAGKNLTFNIKILSVGSS